MKAVVVVASIRPESISKFLDNWDHEFAEHRVILVEDNPTSLFRDVIPYVFENEYLDHYTWEDIDDDLGEHSWIIPRRTSAIKSYGIWKASQVKPDMIVCLDDDCYPQYKGRRFLQTHYEKLISDQSVPAWISTVDGVKPRGLPYRRTDRQVIPVLNHGLWTQNPDIDAITELSLPEDETLDWIEYPNRCIPRYSYFPMCGMNIAFAPKLAPLMYFGLMGKDWPYDRFDDIWCGIFMKKICDHLGWWVSSGLPLVRHSKASDVWKNLEKERSGMLVNEKLWELVDRIELDGKDPLSCYRDLASKLFFGTDGDYWTKLKQAMQAWADLFEANAEEESE